jgi:TolB protein
MWAIHSLAWSADGRRVAFVSGNPSYVFGSTAFGNLGPSSIWTMALDGRPPVRLTTAPFTFGSPVFSPDGRAVLYVSNAGGAWDVHLQPIDGAGNPAGEPRRLLTGSNAYGISLSRDGSRLAYTSMNVRSNVFTAPIPPRGSVTPAAALRPLTDENQTVETVDVTPDGRWLVFESNRDGRARIYRMSVSTGELFQLTHGPLEDFAPRWSPDGRRIAFHSREPSKDGLRDVYVMNADGSGRTRLTADSLDDSYPSWAPDGRRVLFSQVPGGTMASTLGADGRWGRAERDTVRGRWTRDGRSRVFQRRGELYVEGHGGVPRLLMNARQLGEASLTLGIGPDPAVVYARAIDTAGAHSFYSVPLAGGPPRLLLRLDDSSRWMMRVIFAADTRHLYFTRTSAESDIWMVALER